ncbi:MAG TPA: long-chain fatty acid--CoA ligase [Spirochaetota bacterium]|nr:long-chain fatty acid--CoA ligase [Spirochaetota bacterium]HOT19202.1 long-chain fatty acid--CoA ligase [Spirochaetota bacterium]HQG41658.1 long-chain fatty acid--CoA ligase [Spirochaetota bacterium]HQI37203.1 long-chain fatty acid--CoA ligase [Spirochaetota bacterium]
MEEKTINQVFRNRVQKYGSRIALEKKLNGKWESVSWEDYYKRAAYVGLALNDMGLQKGDRVSLLSENRLEWLYADMGVLGAGGCIVPIYPTLIDDEVEYIVSHSDSKFLIVENNAQLQKGLYTAKRYPGLKKIIVIDTTEVNVNPMIMDYNELLDKGKVLYNKNPEAFASLADTIAQDDLATIVYTSGTTGVPKGAMITHKNIMAVIKALDTIEPHYAYDSDQTVPFLPLSHVFERVAGHFYGMYVGITASYAESLDTLIQDIQEKRPTVVLAVPRVLEKVYQQIISQVQEQSPFKQKVFYWGQKVGSKISELREQKKNPGFNLSLKYKIAYAIIFKKLQNALGGRVRWMTASGAPTAREIILFFNSAGIMVIEGYGMTECCAPATMSNIADYRIGTVGRPLPGVDIKIADDGEILIKGDNVFKGYWKMPEETKDSFTQDGYFMSGDIGLFDDAGFLMITDRKKDLIITSGGKNVAPQKIENLIKSDPLFTEAIVIGDKRKYLIALVNISQEQAERIAKEKGINVNSLHDLFNNPRFQTIVEEHIEKCNQKLARYETVKKVGIIKNEFSKETGELTATLKVKRKAVQQKYQSIIDSLYEEDAKTIQIY